MQLGPHRGSLDGHVKVCVDVFHERQRTPGAVPPIDLSSECRDDLWGQPAAPAWMDTLLERVQTTSVVGVDSVTHAFGTHNLERGNLIWCLALNAVPQGQIALSFAGQNISGGQSLTELGLFCIG